MWSVKNHEGLLKLRSSNKNLETSKNFWADYTAQWCVLNNSRQDIRSATSLFHISVLKVEITNWPWISPQKFVNWHSTLFLMKKNSILLVKKHLQDIFLSKLGHFNNLLSPNYWSQRPQLEIKNLACNGPIKVNQKMAIFGFEIWGPGKWNIS